MSSEYQEGIDYIMLLNNNLGRTRQLQGFQWQLTQNGPPNAPVHHAIALLNGQVIGHSEGKSRNAAKRRAAFFALVHLRHL
ncbi:unnamed protein product [Peniophora sp. CBMAI 1063]|nr:unnamed protein product [Peniophora sp. CBMAI 1063]